jgi:deoxyribodipyrimidine photo-lyase
MTTPPQATRQAALLSLENFLSLVPQYPARRSFVSADNRNVSRLSPYLRHRVITEQEVVQRVLQVHSFQAAEKFIQEVVWRTYWKGWLERYPQVWMSCVDSEVRLRGTLHQQSWVELYDRACRGETQLSFFNDWVHELVETGYLHNHARMWFASVWIFTLKLPWQLGAMFMYRHLLDGDPASNTLSWRWVAGLQTKGKSYLARAENISQFSEGRWNPKHGELAEQVTQVELDLEVDGLHSAKSDFEELPAHEYGVLTTGDDLSVECDDQLMSGASSVAVLQFRKVHDESGLVEAFAQGCEDDAIRRLGQRGSGAHGVSEILSWSEAQRLSRVVIVQPPVGPASSRVLEAAKALTERGVQCAYYRSEWDRQLHELADKGFFPFWERVKKRIHRGETIFRGKI